MTNLDKAERIAIDLCGEEARYDMCSNEHFEYLKAEEAAFEMANLKDEEFRTFLEKKKKELTTDNWPISLFGEEKGKADMIDKIINEFFKED